MRVALAHDWLTGLRGGERVLHEHAVLYPDADLYTLVHVPGTTTKAIEDRRIVASPLSRLPGIESRYRSLLPLFPWAASRLRPQGIDLLLSSSHAAIKAVRPPPGAVHLCYCFTPMRYVWDQADAYLGRGLKRALSWPLAEALRRWDRATSGPERVTRFIAISQAVSERIRAHYDREADVIYPPVDTHRFSIRSEGPDDFYLVVGGFVPYKREELAIEAFRSLDRPLWVAGDGPGRAAAEREAPPNVRFLGRVDDETLADLYARCRALVYPQEEDFGIIPVEAMASGRPVIAFGRGGAAETVVPPGDARGRAPTGIWFDAQTPEALAAAVERFEALESELEPAAIRQHAEAFSAARFRREMAAAVEETAARGPGPQ